ncbi:MAG: ABC transporter substrate-binding protein, partial [Candidatus Aquilonibacter sp.]
MRFARVLLPILCLTVPISSLPIATSAADTSPIKIAVITDMTGVYSGLSGQGSVVATKMAVADFGGKVLGRPIVVDVVD